MTTTAAAAYPTSSHIVVIECGECMRFAFPARAPYDGTFMLRCHTTPVEFAVRFGIAWFLVYVIVLGLVGFCLMGIICLLSGWCCAGRERRSLRYDEM